jgi:nitroimidazol reductase NimA-like FMN-containing flavoprotein (pyridoxamine 5'-phosphate oxidase superfamily)
MKMKPYKLPKMSLEEIDKLLNEKMICRIAFKGDDFPYMAPFQYVKMGDTMYFHFTNYGKKMNLIENENRVCVSVESLMPDMSEYSFVVLRGELERVNDSKERGKAIRKLAEAGHKRFSENFLAAHGFIKEEGWETISEEKPMVIFKLEKVSEIVGLKSPN